MEGNPAAAPSRAAASKKARDPRKHHYVPVFYQNNFANEAGLLWVYDRAKRAYKELHPSVVCFEKDLYAVKPENKPRDMQVELKILSTVDSLGFAGIRDFLMGKPSNDAEQQVALFMAFQWSRVPSISRDIRATYAKAIEELNRIAFANVERAKALMERYARDTGEAMNVTPESMVEMVRGKHVEITATEVPFLTNMIEQSMSLARLLIRFDWEVLVAPDETSFIICDCPVVVVPPKGSVQVGFAVPGTAKYFPLSRHQCLRVGKQGRMRRHKRVDKETVRIVNQNIAANSERFIMGPSRVQLENVVSRSKCERIESTPRFILETVSSNEDEALQALSAQPRRYFYPKNGSAYAP
jgi:hypothetical protein